MTFGDVDYAPVLEHRQAVPDARDPRHPLDSDRREILLACAGSAGRRCARASAELPADPRVDPDDAVHRRT